ncbi:unnamed protein product [Ostreobium quekettii]|uniref:Uncharacterized protein n=1 Tax=Ostreobium quekettii TaxID=121088 RepID=A0A8S1J1V8_9CHLO|nr:unnamed protein product [Ostreobium quekettii]
MAIDGASLGVGVLSLLLLAFPWVRMRFRGPGNIQLASILLSRRWGRLDKELENDRKTQAVNGLLRCIHQCGLNLVDPQLLEDIGGHLEAASRQASQIVPSAHTVWLVVLVVAEALQFMAVPFAFVVGWDENIVGQVFHYGLPQYGSEYLEIVLWVVLLPVLVLLSLAVLATVLGTMAWIANRGCCSRSCMPAVFSMGCCMIVKTGIGLYVRGQELLQEFGSMFMFASMLMVFLCPRCSQRKAVLSFRSSVQCWQDSRHFLYVALVVLQLVFQLYIILWNNLPVYSMYRLFKPRATNSTMLHKILEKSVEKDDYLTFLAQAYVHYPGNLAEVELQVFDFDRPMFSSTWSAFSGSLKFALAACFIVFGHRDGYQWVLLGVAAVCYTVMLTMNVFMAPCTVHWINCARNVSLAAGLWATLCGFAVAGTGPRSWVLALFTVGLLIIAVAVLPAMLVFGFRSVQAYQGASVVLRENLLNSYQRMVALFRLLLLRVAPDGAMVDGNESIGVYRIKGLEIVKPTGTLFQGSVKKFKTDVDGWADWAEQGALVCPAACCPCLAWVPLSLPEERTMCELPNDRSEELRQVDPSPHSLIGTSMCKVERWMESADLIVDPERDVELGLSVPLDAYFTTGDGVPKTADDEPHSLSLFYSTTMSDIRAADRDRTCSSCVLPKSTSRLKQLSHNTTPSDDEGPSQRPLDVCVVQTLERAYNRNEPVVPLPQMSGGAERPQSSAFDPGGSCQHAAMGRHGRLETADLGIVLTSVWNRTDSRRQLRNTR